MDAHVPYPADHWMRSADSEAALAAFRDQQSKAYSRVKNRFIYTLLGDLQGKRFLDYGCGAGLFTIHAAQSGAARAVGMDAEPMVLDTARYAAGLAGAQDRTEFLHYTALPRDNQVGTFDALLMKDVIEHVPDDAGLLRAARRLLSPGGDLVVSTQNRVSLNYALEGLYQRVIAGRRNWMGWDDTHLRFYTAPGLRRLLSVCGFTVTATRSVYLVPHTFGIRNLRGKWVRLEFLAYADLLLGRMFPYNMLGWNIILKARRTPGDLPESETYGE